MVVFIKKRHLSIAFKAPKFKSPPWWTADKAAAAAVQTEKIVHSLYKYLWISRCEGRDNYLCCAMRFKTPKLIFWSSRDSEVTTQAGKEKPVSRLPNPERKLCVVGWLVGEGKMPCQLGTVTRLWTGGGSSSCLSIVSVKDGRGRQRGRPCADSSPEADLVQIQWQRVATMGKTNMYLTFASLQRAS